MNYVSYLYEGIIPLLINNHSGINDAESKYNSDLSLLMNQSNESTRNKIIRFLVESGSIKTYWLLPLFHKQKTSKYTIKINDYLSDTYTSISYLI